jgi:hypothetical protein
MSKLAYLALCRSIQLLVLLARGDAAKDLESWCSATNSPCSAAESHGPGSSPPTAPCSPRSAAPYPAPAGPASCQARDAAALAPPPRRGRLDLPTPRSRATAARPGAAAADRSAGQREPALGLPAHPGGAAPARHARLCDRDPHHAMPPRDGSGAEAIGHHLAGVPTPAGLRDHCLRLLYRRYHLAQAAARPVLHRTGHSASAPGRGDGQSQRRLGHPAGPQPPVARGGTPTPHALPHTRS